MPNTDEIELLKELLALKTLPEPYIELLQKNVKGSDAEQPVPGLPLSLELDSAWGATEFLRSAREDLPPVYIVIQFDGDYAFCLDLEDIDTGKDSPVVKISLDKNSPPEKVFDSISKYPELNNETASTQPEFNSCGNNACFQNGLKRLDFHMKNIRFQYDHKNGGQLPRTRFWRPYRFCVQDIILGITVVRHDSRYNRLEIDVFITAKIPEYKENSGCLALALILLSDAYKSGGSMELKFTGNVENGKVPSELVKLAESVGITLKYTENGGITPHEAKELYLALSGFSPKLKKEILSLEKYGKLSSAGVCYGMHHGVWTPEELEVIIFSTPNPETILNGSYPAEAWHLFQYDLFICRNALMGGFLDRNLVRREHPVPGDKGSENSVIELDDDERMIEISFDPVYCAKKYTLKDEEDKDNVPLPWIENSKKNYRLEAGKNIWVLLRSRYSEELQQKLDYDLDRAVELKEKKPDDQVCVMVPGDFRRLNMTAIKQKADEKDIGIICCPDFITQLDQEVCKRLEKIKVMR